MISIPKNAVYQLIPLTSDLYTVGGHLRAYQGYKFRHLSPKDVSDIRECERSLKNKFLAKWSKHEILEVYRASPFDLHIKDSISIMTEIGLDQINVELSATVNISNIVALTSFIMSGEQPITIDDVEKAMKTKLYALLLSIVSSSENSHDICQTIQYMRRPELEDVFASIGLSVSNVSTQAYSTLEAESRQRIEHARIEDEQRRRELIYELQKKMGFDPAVYMEVLKKLSENPMFDMNSFIHAFKTALEYNQSCIRFLSEKSSRCEPTDRSDHVLELLADPNDYSDHVFTR